MFDAGKACKDLAAVHTGGGECRGSRAHHNWIHGSSGIGLRGDDQTRGLTVHHNVTWDCGFYGIIVKGDDNLVYHNTTDRRPRRRAGDSHRAGAEEVVDAPCPRSPCRTRTAACSTTRPRPGGSAASPWPT